MLFTLVSGVGSTKIPLLWNLITLMAFCSKCCLVISISFFFSSNTTWNKSLIAITTCTKLYNCFATKDFNYTNILLIFMMNRDESVLP